MSIQIQKTPLPGLIVLIPQRFSDERGFFSESWNRRTLQSAGIDLPEFVQDNHSLSHRTGTLRGMHYQAPPFAQGKLVRCGRGHILDVAVDVRKGSPTYGHWHGEELSYEIGRQLWVPAGFLHGFVTRETDSEIIYKCTAHYDRASDGAVRWDSLGIDWGVASPLLSPKDAAAIAFADFDSPFTYEA